MPATMAGTARSRSASGNLRARLRGAGEAHPPDARVGRERGTGLGAVAGDHVDDARRDPGLPREPGEGERGERGVLGRLDHDRVARGDRGAGVVHEHRARRVPRDHAADHAERLAQGQAQHVRRLGRQRQTLHLVGLACDEHEDAGHRRRSPVRAAHLLRLEPVELGGVFLDERRPAGHERAARGGAGVAPRRERGLGGPHGGVHVGRGAAGHAGERFPGRRVDHLDRRACRRGDPLVPDEVGVLDEQRGCGSGRHLSARGRRRRGRSCRRACPGSPR
jgi:hypothetical protein